MGEGRREDWYFARIDTLWRPNRLLKLMKEVWKVGYVVQDWKDAEIVPIPKKGDLRNCDDWRGISLLDVVRHCGRCYGSAVFPQ